MAGAAVVNPSRVILSAGNMLLHHGTTPPRAVDEGDEWTAAAARRAAGARCRHASGEEQLVAEATTPAVSGAGRGVGDDKTTPARDLVADGERGKWLGIWRTMGEGVLIQREICKIAPQINSPVQKNPRLACVAGQTVKQYATWDKYGDAAYAVTCAVNKCNDKHRNLGIP